MDIDVKVNRCYWCFHKLIVNHICLFIPLLFFCVPLCIDSPNMIFTLSTKNELSGEEAAHCVCTSFSANLRRKTCDILTPCSSYCLGNPCWLLNQSNLNIELEGIGKDLNQVHKPGNIKIKFISILLNAKPC